MILYATHAHVPPVVNVSVKSVHNSKCNLCGSNLLRLSGQVLVELAQERDEDIPALVYEARSTGQPRRLPHNRRQQRQPGQDQTGTSVNVHLDDASAAALHQVIIAQTSNDSPGDRKQAVLSNAQQ